MTSNDCAYPISFAYQQFNNRIMHMRSNNSQQW